MFSIKRTLLNLITPFKPLVESLVEKEANLATKWVSTAYGHLKKTQWTLPPLPEHFDHRIDLFSDWLFSRNSLWIERGVFSSLALKGGQVLELACGDGFNARNFYSLRSQAVIACDFDIKAIKTAKKYNSAQNVTFILADIRTSMPDGQFDNIIWDAAIEHFTPAEIAKILADIKSRLINKGILSGYTIVELNSGKKQLAHHEYEFKSKDDLARFLTPHFSNVKVFETIYPNRHNLYFYASDAILPFDKDWPFQILITH